MKRCFTLCYSNTKNYKYTENKEILSNNTKLCYPRILSQKKKLCYPKIAYKEKKFEISFTRNIKDWYKHIYNHIIINIFKWKKYSKMFK